MTTKIIKTEADHAKALARIEEIFAAKPGTAAGDELDLLTMLVEQFEKNAFPIGLPDPIAAIRFRMDQRSRRRGGSACAWCVDLEVSGAVHCQATVVIPEGAVLRCLGPKFPIVVNLKAGQTVFCTRAVGHKGKHVSCSIVHGMHPAYMWKRCKWCETKGDRCPVSEHWRDRANNDNLLCCREKGHKGKHVACTSRRHGIERWT